MPAIAKRTTLVRESIIRRISVLCSKVGAINLAQGFPEERPEDWILSNLQKAIYTDMHQYTDTWGTQELRTTLCGYLSNLWKNPYLDPTSNVHITTGAITALNLSLYGVGDPGEEVIILEPFYEGFKDMVLMRGLIPVYVPLKADNNRLCIDIPAIEKSISKKTCAIIVNSPCNPSGCIFSFDELRALYDIAKFHNIWVLSDETYHRMYYTQRPTSMAEVDMQLTNTCVVGGFGKTFGVTGWRIGYLVGNKDFVHALRAVCDWSYACAPSLFQKAVVDLCAAEESYFTNMSTNYWNKFNILKTGLDSLGFQYIIPEGAYYVLCTLPTWFEGTSTAFNDFMIESIGIGAVPGKAFYDNAQLGDTTIRFTFSKSAATLREASDRMTKYRNDKLHGKL